MLYPRGNANLILVGFMGTGKTALGHALALAWRRQFIDTDRLIQEKTGRTIPEIFATDGEAYFRELEKKCVAEWLPEKRTIISTGGGIVTIDGMNELLAKKGVVIALFAGIETIFHRVSCAKNRPLLNAESREEQLEKIRTLYRSREEKYIHAGVNLSTEFSSIPELVDRVTQIYNRRAKRE